MNADLNNVKNGNVRRYHHGDLRASLIVAGLALIEEVGPDAFSLRAVARRAGVSPAAPAHHFSDTRGLLTAIATDGFVEFGDAIEKAVGVDRNSAMRAQCHAYLRFALERPGLFRLMWRKGMLDTTDVAHLAAARRAFVVSDRAIRGDQITDTMLDESAPITTIACWAMVHGFVMLVLDGAFFAVNANSVETIRNLLDGVLAHFKLDID